MSNEDKTERNQFSISFGAWQFEPKLKLSIISLLLILILVYLGVWQLFRAHEKKILYLQLQQKSTQRPILLQTIDQPSWRSHRYTSVLIDGVFLNQYTFLIDNQIYKHQPGYRVITPVQTPQVNEWILVDRGWIPLGIDRQHLPEVEPIFGLKDIRGVINTIPSGIVLKDDQIQDFPKWPLVLQKVDYSLIEKQLHHPVSDFVIQLQSSDLIQYSIPPLEIGLAPTKHIGYALQWFTFAVMAFIYYVIASSRRR